MIGMRCDSSSKLVGMMILSTSFMIVEMVVGNLTNSMALVADSFHMLSDVIALIIAFVSVRLGQRTCSVSTFGWARVEVVGALINAVFLYAQCFAIFLQAVKRFLVIEKIEDPKMLLIVGGLGLIINLVGMLIFGQGQGHSHKADDDAESEPTEPSQAETGGEGEDLNIRGVFLHVMADALGSVVVMVSAS